MRREETIEAKNGQTILNAQVPLAEMFGYATAIMDQASKKPAART